MVYNVIQVFYFLVILCLAVLSKVIHMGDFICIACMDIDKDIYCILEYNVKLGK